MFRLNEAPNEVLSAISSHQTARNCGTFWSVVCCLPTFGATVGLENKNPNWSGCCYPNSVSLESDVTLNVLIGKLNQLRMSSKQLREQISNDPMQDERKVIEWQVKETCALLNKALNDNLIEGSYKQALNDAYRQIHTQAQQEEGFGQLLDKEKSPLLSTQPYTPHYGMRMTKD